MKQKLRQRDQGKRWKRRKWLTHVFPLFLPSERNCTFFDLTGTTKKGAKKGGERNQTEISHDIVLWDADKREGSREGNLRAFFSYLLLFFIFLTTPSWYWYLSPLFFPPNSLACTLSFETWLHTRASVAASSNGHRRRAASSVKSPTKHARCHVQFKKTAHNRLGRCHPPHLAIGVNRRLLVVLDVVRST